MSLQKYAWFAEWVLIILIKHINTFIIIKSIKNIKFKLLQFVCI